tara:strand:+ start:139 stop:465 length:327 start_codon:yes stop_codon:yes gene_type:complete
MSRRYSRWTLDEEIKLLENIKINKDNHTLTASNLERSLSGVISRLIGIYKDRLNVYQGENPDDLMNELYLNEEQINKKYKASPKKKTIISELELLNIKIDMILNRNMS